MAFYSIKYSGEEEDLNVVVPKEWLDYSKESVNLPSTQTSKADYKKLFNQRSPPDIDWLSYPVVQIFGSAANESAAEKLLPKKLLASKSGRKRKPTPRYEETDSDAPAKTRKKKADPPPMKITLPPSRMPIASKSGSQKALPKGPANSTAQRVAATPSRTLPATPSSNLLVTKVKVSSHVCRGACPKHCSPDLEHKAANMDVGSFKKLLNEMVEIKLDVKQMRVDVKELKISGVAATHLSGPSAQGQCSSIFTEAMKNKIVELQNFIEFEDSLKLSEADQSCLKRAFQVQGGTDLAMQVRNCLALVLSNDVALKFCVEGSDTKYTFKDTKYYAVLRDALVTPTNTVAQLNSSMSEWFNDAPKRKMLKDENIQMQKEKKRLSQERKARKRSESVPSENNLRGSSDEDLEHRRVLRSRPRLERPVAAGAAADAQKSRGKGDEKDVDTDKAEDEDKEKEEEKDEEKEEAEDKEKEVAEDKEEEEEGDGKKAEDDGDDEVEKSSDDDKESADEDDEEEDNSEEEDSEEENSEEEDEDD